MRARPLLAINCAFVFLVLSLASGLLMAAEPRQPLHRTVDLNAGEEQTVKRWDGTTANVRLLAVTEARDTVRSAVREARVKVEVNGESATLVSANYRLPILVGGFQIDCPITRGYNLNPSQEAWGLVSDARLRLWPKGSPWTAPGTFIYPIRQRWFAGATQMANEPSFIDGGDEPGKRPIYYHSGLDIGGAEGMIEVISAVDALIVSVGQDVLEGHRQETPVEPRQDVVYLLDDRGWYYRYSHLKEIDPAIRPGRTVTMGQRIGVLGKEGATCWSHLHFEIKSRQPSGKWGTEEGYPFIWEAALREQKPEIVAVARPHRLAWTGEAVTLDGSRSWSAAGEISRFEWSFGDSATANGARVDRTNDKPGTYSEILKVIDARGRIAHDFAAVHVMDKEHPDKLPPIVHASYAPTDGIHLNDPVTFKARTFRAKTGNETWNFGDGTPPVTVHSDANANPHAPNGYAELVCRLTHVHLAEKRFDLGLPGTLVNLRAFQTISETVYFFEPFQHFLVQSRSKQFPAAKHFD